MPSVLGREGPGSCFTATGLPSIACSLEYTLKKCHWWVGDGVGLRFITNDEAGLGKGSLAIRRGMRVAIALPSGAEMWVAILQVMCYAIAVPVNIDNTAHVR